LDISRPSLQKVYTLEYRSYWIDIHVNKTDPTTLIFQYIINYKWYIKICKIVDKTIVIGDGVEIGFHLGCFYGKCVYGLNRRYENEEKRLVGEIYMSN
jgi:hypothetical protein